MIIGLFGESCTGKSTIADELSKRLNATVYTGKDYLKLSKVEAEAKKAFHDLLSSNEAADNILIYVISEKEHLALLPKKAVRVLITADLGTIKERFSKRMHGNLPAPVAAMLEKKHGSFDNEKHDLHIESGKESLEAICAAIIQLSKL